MLQGDISVVSCVCTVLSSVLISSHASAFPQRHMERLPEPYRQTPLYTSGRSSDVKRFPRLLHEEGSWKKGFVDIRNIQSVIMEMEPVDLHHNGGRCVK